MVSRYRSAMKEACEFGKVIFICRKKQHKFWNFIHGQGHNRLKEVYKCLKKSEFTWTHLRWNFFPSNVHFNVKIFSCLCILSGFCHPGLHWISHVSRLNQVSCFPVIFPQIQSGVMRLLHSLLLYRRDYGPVLVNLVTVLVCTVFDCGSHFLNHNRIPEIRTCNRLWMCGALSSSLSGGCTGWKQTRHCCSRNILQLKSMCVSQFILGGLFGGFCLLFFSDELSHGCKQSHWNLQLNDCSEIPRCSLFFFLFKLLFFLTDWNLEWNCVVFINFQELYLLEMWMNKSTEWSAQCGLKLPVVCNHNPYFYYIHLCWCCPTLVCALSTLVFLHCDVGDLSLDFEFVLLMTDLIQQHFPFCWICCWTRPSVGDLHSCAPNRWNMSRWQLHTDSVPWHVVP